MDLTIIRSIAEIGRKLYDRDMANYYEGNISVKSDVLLYITPGRVNKDSLREEQICVIDEAGRQVFGEDAPSSELPMHRAVHEMRSGKGGAVIHSHPPYLTAYALCCMPIKSDASPEFLAYFGGSIRVAKYGRPGTPAIFENALGILEEDDIVLLGNHGVLVYGVNLTRAFDRLETAESMAKTISIAGQLGGETPLPKEERDLFLELYRRRPQ